MHDPLTNLHDIHLPDIPGFWPLSVGWYLAFFCILLSAHLVYHFNKKRKPKKIALKLLLKYQNDFIKHQDTNKSAAMVSELLRRVALKYYPRTEVASLQGVKWLDFLNSKAKKADFSNVSNELIYLPYQKNAKGDINLLFNTAKIWIKEQKKHV